jgi:hypothetical protein
LFDYGALQTWLGDAPGGAASWQRLIDELPTSSLRPLTLLALAVYHFDAQDLVAARQSLSEVLAIPDFPGRGDALYLDAWCALNQQQGAQALDLLLQAFALAAQRGDDATHQELVRALPLFFALGGDPARARETVAAVAAGDLEEILAAIAAEYESRGLSDQAATVREQVAPPVE